MNPAELLARHQNGDWGVVSPADAKENDFYSVKHALRTLSSYAVGRAGERVWILTEADRSSTCILLPEESKSSKGGAQVARALPVGLDALNAELIEVARETMQPAHLSSWLRPGTPPKGS